VVQMFHVIFMARKYTGPTGPSYQDDHRHVGVMPATPTINIAGLVRRAGAHSSSMWSDSHSNANIS